MSLSYIHVAKKELNGKIDFRFRGFHSGVKWMSKYLKKSMFSKHPYLLYGVIKYGLSSLGILIALLLAIKIHFLLLFLAIPLFYFIEVHFLFLFPLLIENHNKPMIKNLSLIYKIGVLNCAYQTFLIGVYMIQGLFSFKNPFKNWYIGCLAIVIWYKDEIRIRP